MFVEVHEEPVWCNTSCSVVYLVVLPVTFCESIAFYFLCVLVNSQICNLSLSVVQLYIMCYTIKFQLSIAIFFHFQIMYIKFSFYNQFLSSSNIYLALLSQFDSIICTEIVSIVLYLLLSLSKLRSCYIESLFKQLLFYHQTV